MEENDIETKQNKIETNEEKINKENKLNMDNKPEKKQTILVVDDEKTIVDILVYNLNKEGYETLEAYDGQEAIKIALERKPDLILLDIMIPKIDGLTVCKRLRHTLNIPILILSAKDEEIDKIVGLELGADDYITKPFSVRELMARVKANLRKIELKNVDSNEEIEEIETQKEKVENEDNNSIIKIGDLSINIDKYDVKIRGKSIDLTLREFELISYLAKQSGQVITREELLENVWGYEYYGDIRTVDVTIKRIRAKIEKDKSAPKIIITRRGVGYYIATK